MEDAVLRIICGPIVYVSYLNVTSAVKNSVSPTVASKGTPDKLTGNRFINSTNLFELLCDVNISKFANEY